ncbi:RAB3 GTPase activating protein subunit 1 [Brevipalpus obovatus]|uniref:RAB3 GTPase activating protein subunit 1 n=1 Tax=Brevipalpus obovatus TaxID=246614 RepID=UPI003D9E7B9B
MHGKSGDSSVDSMSKVTAEIDEDQIFEMTDFTTATDWERFVADLEEILRNWNCHLYDHASPSNRAAIGRPERSFPLIPKTENLCFGKVPLLAKLYVYHRHSGLSPENDHDLPLITEMMDPRHDFPHKVHCLFRWYGVRQFIVLSPTNDELINSYDRCKLLLSSAAIAQNNTNIYIPVFVQLHQPQRKFFHGILEAPTFRINYDMIHGKRMTESYCYLSELINLFREKLNSPSVERPSIRVSVRLTHVLKEWPTDWLESRVRSDFNLENRLHHLEESPLNILEYQHANNPIDEIHLSASWNDLAEEMISDSLHHSNLDSMNAPRWSARAAFKDLFAKDLILSLEQLLLTARSSKYADQVLGHYSAHQEERESEARAALDKLTGPPSLTLPQIKTSSRWYVSDDLRAGIIKFLFGKPDLNDSSEAINSIFKDYRGFKSSPFNNLTWRLAVLFYHLRDFRSVAYMWSEIIKELRDHWETLVDLPKLESGSPDLSSCLLNQKFQMLNCCIEQRRKREEAQNNPISSSCQQSNSEGEPNIVGEDDDEDQFFDAIDQEEDIPDRTSGLYRPEGRLHQLNDLQLLGSDELLYVPITQEPPPMTEDMLQEHAKILSELGTSPEAAALRAKMQSASLISDMEAFKAANPGCKLEDFVRWHSPRDFIEEEAETEKVEKAKAKEKEKREKEERKSVAISHHSSPLDKQSTSQDLIDQKLSSQSDPVVVSSRGGNQRGHLSSRMQHPGNMWQEAWNSARPIPVSRQKRLFDYTKEAERVLYSFASLTLSDLVLKLMPCLIHCATSQLIKLRESLGLDETHLNIGLQEVSRLCSLGDYDKCLLILGPVEAKLIKLQCLKKIFSIVHENCGQELGESGGESFSWSKVANFALRLVADEEIDIPGASSSYIGSLILNMFGEASQSVYEEKTSIGERVSSPHLLDESSGGHRDHRTKLPTPMAKEYILKTNCARPSVYSKQLPQRMFALITANEFRLSGTFSQDTLFR